MINLTEKEARIRIYKTVSTVMSEDDLKQFLEDEHRKINPVSYQMDEFNRLKTKLGLFFWERGGKQFVLNSKELSFNELVLDANRTLLPRTFMNPESKWVLWANNFLDALACLGEEQIKELIKELK